MSLRDLRRHAGQFVMIGFAGSSIPVEVRTLVREFDLGGVVLFTRNIEDPVQVAELAFEIRHLSETHLWVAVDQEGGRVARLRAGFTEWPPMATLGRAGDRGLVERFAKALAQELKAVGITFDFAPVLDVGTNPRNPVIGDRALSDDPAVVAEYGAIIIRALQAEGVAACGKHFPGHGDTSADSHLELPVIEHPPDRFEAVEFVPFKDAIESHVASIMVGHLLVPAFDEKQPATISERIVRGQLRDRLGFNGLICTDDMDMKAITGSMTVDRAALQAVAAGCDLVLVCGTNHDEQASVIEAIIRGAEQGFLDIKRVERARTRQRRAKEQFLLSPVPRPLASPALSQLISTTEHAAVAEAMAVYV